MVFLADVQTGVGRFLAMYLVGRGGTLPTLRSIRPSEIDYERARGAKDGDEGAKATRVLDLLEDRLVVIFLVCAVLFHFANAAMLPLLGEMLAKGRGRSSMDLGYRPGFLFLAAVAAAGFAILIFFMPETRDARSTAARAREGATT